MNKIVWLLCCMPFMVAGKIKKPVQYDALAIKLALHELIDPYNGCLQAGIEYKPCWDIGIQAECGFNAVMPYLPKDKENSVYWKYKLRGTWTYFEKQKVNMYAGLDFLYYKKEYDLQKSTVFIKDEYVGFEKAHISKSTLGIFLVDGVTIKGWSHFRLDMDANVGLRVTRIAYSKLENVSAAQIPKDAIFPYLNENVTGIHYYPHIGIGVRFGYVLLIKKIQS